MYSPPLTCTILPSETPAARMTLEWVSEPITIAPVFLAITGTSAMWSQWPCPTRIWSAFITCWSIKTVSVGSTASWFSLFWRKPDSKRLNQGSIRMVLLPKLISQPLVPNHLKRTPDVPGPPLAPGSSAPSAMPGSSRERPTLAAAAAPAASPPPRNPRLVIPSVSMKHMVRPPLWVLDERHHLDRGGSAPEALEIERRDVHGARPSVRHQLGHELSGDWSVHEAVAAEAGDHVEAVEPRDHAQDSHLVRRHLIEPGPGPHDRRVREGGNPPHRTLGHRRHQVQIRGGVERARLTLPPVAHHDSRPLPPDGEAVVVIDDERRLERDRLGGHRPGDELAPTTREDRDLDSGQPADQARPAPGRDDDHRRLDLALQRAHGRAASATQKAGHLAILLDHDTELAGAGRDRGGYQVRVGKAVAGRVGRGDQVAGPEVRAERADVVRRQHPRVDAQGALPGRALRVDRLLLPGLLQDQVAVLVELRVDPELGLEVLVDLDAMPGQLDADAVGVLMTDAAAGQRGRAGADRPALEHEHPTVPTTREVVRRAGAHDAGPDDDRVRGVHHAGRLTRRGSTS